MFGQFLGLYMIVFFISFSPTFILQLVSSYKFKGLMRYLPSLVLNALYYVFALLGITGLISFGEASSLISGLVLFIAAVMGSLGVVTACLFVRFRGRR